MSLPLEYHGILKLVVDSQTALTLWTPMKGFHCSLAAVAAQSQLGLPEVEVMVQWPWDLLLHPVVDMWVCRKLLEAVTLSLEKRKLKKKGCRVSEDASICTVTCIFQ